MPDNSDINYHSSKDDEARNLFFELTTKASVAENSGQELMAVNLYIAAYEVCAEKSDDLLNSAIVGIKKA